MARLTTSAPAIRAERPEVSQALDDVIHRCLARQPEARFGSAAAVRDALDRARLDPTGSLPQPVAPTGTGPAHPVPRPAAPPAHTGPTSPQPVPAPPPAPAPRRRRRRLGWLWALLVLLVAIAGGVLAYVLVSDGSSSNGANGGAGAAPPTASKVVLTPTAFDPLGDGTENPGAVQQRRRRRPDHELVDRAVRQLPRRRQERRGTRVRARRRRRREQGLRRDPAERLGRVDLRAATSRRRRAHRPSATGVRRGRTVPTSSERTPSMSVGSRGARCCSGSPSCPRARTGSTTLP